MSNRPAEGSGSRASDARDAAERDPLDGEGGEEGIALTTGEPTSFEPEEDPEPGSNTETD